MSAPERERGPKVPQKYEPRDILARFGHVLPSAVPATDGPSDASQIEAPCDAPGADVLARAAEADPPGADGPTDAPTAEGPSADGRERFLPRLTDEELTIVDPQAAERGLVALPHLRGMSDQEREWVLATALRSLVSRELVEVDNIAELAAFVREPGDSGSMDVRMRYAPELELVLALRRSADRAVAVELTSAAGTSYAYVFANAPDLLLIERVTGGGLHLFSVAQSAREAAKGLRELVDPFGAARQDGAVLELDPRAVEAGRVGDPLKSVIDNAQVVGQLTVLAGAPGPLLMTYAGDSEVWIVSVDAPHAPTGIAARSVDEWTLTDAIARLLVPSQ
ncbi:hypothetical protein RKE29_11610 [Streptomyces sp. B1866]|uniref:hypothetical protein n=1 Tax=Streptomyces sp. B1866 TaxID=3075431 RepID=UPI00289219A9|nr:hypothetical protein [Streptomyces sp. B1866]MDT3397285.1 hypothetical protein [Streptomyces sp. B1866]